MVRTTHSTEAVRLFYPPSILPFPAASHDNCRGTGDVSDVLQNIMLWRAKIDTFIKHYLPRRVTADTRAIACDYEP
jgi:hypothetical protein